MNILIIPARGNSKRIPKKNIKIFNGKPAIYWPINAAKQSNIFDRIIVSTDNEEIAQIAESFGAEIPYLRDASLSDDYTGTTEVISDTVSRLNLAEADAVCCLYATALFVRPEDIKKGREQLEGGAQWALSLCEYPTPIDRAYVKHGNSFSPKDHNSMPKRSQDLPKYYFDVGQFYWARAKTWRSADSHVWDGANGVEIPFERAIDIDTPEDWARAELLSQLLM